MLWIFYFDFVSNNIAKESESEVTQSCLILCDPMDYTHQVPLSMGFSR